TPAPASTTKAPICAYHGSFARLSCMSNNATQPYRGLIRTALTLRFLSLHALSLPAFFRRRRRRRFARLLKHRFDRELDQFAGRRRQGLSGAVDDVDRLLEVPGSFEVRDEIGE